MGNHGGVGGCTIYNIVTGVTSDVGVPATYLVDNKPALFQVMNWQQTGNKSSSELMMTQFTDEYVPPIPKMNSQLFSNVFQ